jgi:hypothetical protein
MRKLVYEDPRKMGVYILEERRLEEIEFYTEAFFSQLHSYMFLVGTFFTRTCRLLRNKDRPHDILKRLKRLASRRRRGRFEDWAGFVRTVRNRLLHESALRVFPRMLLPHRFLVYVATKDPWQSDKVEVGDFFGIEHLGRIIPRVDRWSRLCEVKLLSLIDKGTGRTKKG